MRSCRGGVLRRVGMEAVWAANGVRRIALGTGMKRSWGRHSAPDGKRYTVHAVARGVDGYMRGAHSASREALYRSRRHVDYVPRATVAVMSSAALSCRRSRPRSSRRYSAFRTVTPPAYRARRSAAASTGQQKGAPHGLDRGRALNRLYNYVFGLWHSIIRRRKHCASSARSRTRKALLSTSSCERPRPSSYALRWAFHNAPSCGLPE